MNENDTSNTATTPPPFDPRRFERELWIDAAMRWTVGIVVGIGLAYLAIFGFASAEAVIGLVLLVGAWLVIVGVSARATVDLATITAALEGSPGQAESQLATALGRKPLLRPVRLLLYHRLATLRHRQRRFAEAAAIARAVLAQPMGKAGSVRPHLLLILAESLLEIGDAVGTYLALNELHYSRLSLTESLQRLAVQTRYEVLMGRPDAALYRYDRKAQLAELLPAPQAGALHAMLAAAARDMGDAPLAEWLGRRAALLCTPDQLKRLQPSAVSDPPIDEPDSPLAGSDSLL